MGSSASWTVGRGGPLFLWQLRQLKLEVFATLLALLSLVLVVLLLCLNGDR